MRKLAPSALAALMLAVSPAAAQETRLGEEDFESPPATLGQMDWLIGQWSGAGIGAAEAHESWLAPSGGTMVGTFIQENGDGSIMFTEHMYLMEENGSLVVRLKHFNADLTAWEDKEGMATFRLVAIEECAAYFHALTYRCTDDGGLVVAVRMKSDKPDPQELVFRFERARQAKVKRGRCPDAETTMAMNECYAGLLKQAEARRAEYLAAAIAKEAERPRLIAKINASDLAFAAYRDAECGAVLEDWIEGTIRGVMMLGCRIELTDRRTRTIWQNWLKYMDSTPPILPEPKPTQ